MAVILEERGRGKFKPPDYKVDEVKELLNAKIEEERHAFADCSEEIEFDKLNYDPNKWNLLSLFSGCGGLDLGFELAGYKKTTNDMLLLLPVQGIFGMDASKSDKEKNAYIAEELTKMFPNFKMVASVWRTETSITTFKLQSMIYTDGKAYYSQEFFMNILDYIGAGDAYCAGIIYSLINGFEPQKAVEFSNAASCLKHTVSGDFNLVSVDEVMKLAFAKAGNEVSR